MIKKYIAVFFLLTTSFLLTFQSVVFASHADDDIDKIAGHSNLAIPTVEPSSPSGYLGRLYLGSQVPVGHTGYTSAIDQDPDTGQIINLSEYQDINDVWKISAIRGDKITIDLKIQNVLLPELGTYDQFFFDMALYEPYVTTVDDSDNSYNDTAKLTYTEYISDLGIGPENSDSVTHLRLVFTVNMTGTHYLKISGEFDDLFNEYYGAAGRPYKLKATIAKPAAISSSAITGYLSDYPPETGTFSTSNNYFTMSNIRSGDEVVLTLSSTTTSGLSVRVSAYNTAWGSPVSGAAVPKSDIVTYGSAKTIRFKPTSTNLIVRVESLSYSEGGYSLAVKVIKKSSISIAAPSIISYPGKAKIYGRITCGTQTRANFPVDIWQKPSGGAWSKLATVKTNSTGVYQYYATLSKLTSYKVVWDGDPEAFTYYAGSTSVTKVVKVTPSLSIAASKTLLYLGNSAVISGKIGPFQGHSGKLIYIQLYNSATGSWSGIGSAKLSSTGAYSFTWKPTAKGSYKVRAFFVGDADHQSKTSFTKSITVK